MKENRTQIRFDISLAARWEGSASNQNVRISDLSVGGCYVDSIVEVTVGETLLLNIMMPNGKWLELKGVVVHHNSRLGFGVRFVDPDGQQLQQIHALLRLQNENPFKWLKTG